jgi:hypothetical protein
MSTHEPKKVKITPLTHVRPTDTTLNLDQNGFYSAHKITDYYLRDGRVRKENVDKNDEGHAVLHIRAGDVFEDETGIYWVLKAEKGHACARVIRKEDIPIILRKVWEDWQDKTAAIFNRKDEGKNEALAYAHAEIDLRHSKLLKGVFAIDSEEKSSFLRIDEVGGRCILRCCRKPRKGEVFIASMIHSTIGARVVFFHTFLVTKITGNEVTITCISENEGALLTKGVIE